MVSCPDCKQQNPSNHRYCWNCGCPLRTSKTEDEWEYTAKEGDRFKLNTNDEESFDTPKKDSSFSNIPAEIVEGEIKENCPHTGLLTIDESGVRFGDHEGKLNYLFENVSIEKIKIFNYRLNFQWPNKAGYFEFIYISERGKDVTLIFRIDFKTGKKIGKRFNEIEGLCTNSGIEFTLQNLVHPHKIRPTERARFTSQRYYSKEELVGKTVFNSKASKVGNVVDVGYSKEGEVALIVKPVKGKKKVIPLKSVNEISDIILLRAIRQ